MTTEEQGIGAHVTDRGFDIEERWPELFVRLDAIQRRAVVQSLAVSWHAGWAPNREDVADLVERALGEISSEEYRQRSLAKAERVRRAAEAIHSGPMEGRQVTGAGQADAQEHVAGCTDSDDVVARARARRGVPVEEEGGR